MHLPYRPFCTIQSEDDDDDDNDDNDNDDRPQQRMRTYMHNLGHLTTSWSLSHVIEQDSVYNILK